VIENSTDRLPTARYLRSSGEAVLFFVANLSAWPFGCAGTGWEAIAAFGVALLASLWAAHSFVTRQFRFRLDVVSSCLTGLIILSVLQIVPLPMALVRVISPARAQLQADLVPVPLEQLPGEATAVSSSSWVPLSVEPYATYTFAARLLAVFVVYAAARNWLADRASFRRLAWVALINGIALSTLAIAQFFSPNRQLMYWVFDHGVVGYGPFVCRNHYPDFLALSIGMAIGLMLTRDERREKERKNHEEAAGLSSAWEQVIDLLTAPIVLLDRPLTLAAAIAVGFMLVSVPFSLSRGGLLAIIGAAVFTWFLGRWRASAASGSVGWALTATVAVILAVLFWKGTAPIQERFANTFAATADDRTPLWIAGGKQWPGFWLAGSGNGTFQRVEPLGRSTPGAMVYEHAHNEYLEAGIEGGLIRFTLTLVLVVGLLYQVAAGYHKLRERSSGGLLLGAWFGLLMLALHAVTDFAIHIPAIALMAATIAGYAYGISVDTEYSNKRRRSTPPVQLMVPKGQLATPWLFPVLLALVALVAALDARNRYRAERFQTEAALLGAVETAEQLEHRFTLLERRTRIAPADANAWYELAQAHSDAAQLSRRAGKIPPEAIEQQVIPALRALRTARELCILDARVQTRLGVYAQHFAVAESAMNYLERARRLSPNEGEIWFACGTEAFRANDFSAATANWRRALELNPALLKLIVRAANGFPANELRDQILPDDPVVLVAAANELYPPGGSQTSERRLFLVRALEGVNRAKLSRNQLNAVAAAGWELVQPEPVTAMWTRAIQENRDDPLIRTDAARWFEQEELYPQAVDEFEWLLCRDPSNRDLADRLRSSKHGQKLQQMLGR
jgi:O-antigen ligase